MFYRPAVVVFVIMSPGGYFVRALCNLHEAYLLQPDYNLQEYNDIHTTESKEKFHKDGLQKRKRLLTEHQTIEEVEKAR